MGQLAKAELGMLNRPTPSPQAARAGYVHAADECASKQLCHVDFQVIQLQSQLFEGWEDKQSLIASLLYIEYIIDVNTRLDI
jgi:hypothetical protein